MKAFVIFLMILGLERWKIMAIIKIGTTPHFQIHADNSTTLYIHNLFDKDNLDK